MGSFFCALCENALEEVRPGKFQCPYCEGVGGWNLTTIERVSNGWIVRSNDGERTATTVFDDEKGEAQNFAEMLQYLACHYGMVGSRHDAERVYIEVRPGDKWEGR